MLSQCAVVLLLLAVRALSSASAHECTPCNLRACPVRAATARGCDGGRTVARDPCGCCDLCTRLEWEPCGGQDWSVGYCGLGLTCATVNGTGPAVIPEIGVCKVLPDHPEAGLEDERCPLITGCDRVEGQCVCDARHSCLGSFTFPDQESCTKASQSDGRRHEHRERHRDTKYVGPSNPACLFSGCNLTAEGCVCESQSCHHHFTYINRSQCQKAADALRCSDVTCPPLAASSCPSDSVLTRSFTPPAGCCPSIAPQCTCDFSTCHKPLCPTGQRAEKMSQASGQPGDCCDDYECQKSNST